MMSLDLKPYGINATVNIEGDVVGTFVANSGTTLFFFEERHDCEAGIRSCLRMARRLIDTGIVQVVCVEGYPTGVKEGVESQGLAGLVEALKRAQVGEDDLIASSSDFAFTVYVLRPATRIMSIEDPDAYKHASEVLLRQRAGRPARIMDAVVRECGGDIAALKVLDKGKLIEISKKVLREALAEMEDTIRRDVKDPRDSFYIENISKHVSPMRPGNAAIVNLGKSHHGAVISGLRKAGGYSILRIRPDGLKEFEEQLARDPRFHAIKRIRCGGDPSG